jgi:hypothetical protein
MGYIRFIKERLKARKTLSRLKNLENGTVSSPSFFILSAGRSGSTLLRKELMECCHVIIPPESEDMIIKVSQIYFEQRNYIDKIKAILLYINSQSYLTYWNINFKVLEEQLSNSEKSLPEMIETIYRTQKMEPNQSNYLIGDKTPFLNYYLQEINALFPKAKLVYLVRDPRAVVASYLKNRNHTLDESIHRWETSIKTYLKYKSVFGTNVLEVKYETYILDNKKETQKIIAFLGLQIRNGKIQIETSNLGDTHLAHHHNIKNPINSDAIDKWKSELTKDEIEKIEKKLTPLMQQFDYTLFKLKN